jgi:hypothetical protein
VDIDLVMTFLEEHAGAAKQLSHVLSHMRSAEMFDRDHGAVESWLFGLYAAI